MGTYSFGEFLEQFGGMPEPGETHPDPEAIDALRKREREEPQDHEQERTPDP
jgi:hypothetical protein